jgi:hypothetical protein
MDLYPSYQNKIGANRSENFRTHGGTRHDIRFTTKRSSNHFLKQNKIKVAERPLQIHKHIDITVVPSLIAGNRPVQTYMQDAKFSAQPREGLAKALKGILAVHVARILLSVKKFGSLPIPLTSPASAAAA